jgi:N6-adenosine-specific RNA methylase IME4
MNKLPRGRFGAILADPPWRFRTWSETNQRRSASRYYSLMTLENIKALPIPDIAADDCVLFLWAINPMLPHALDVIDAWGFTFKTVAFTWVKTTPSTQPRWHLGLGYWTRANTETCLLATRGKPKRVAKDVRQLLISRRREHSRKPGCVYGRIERLVAGPSLELFARQRREGWKSWGDQIEKFR